jgi:DNA modification methylase
MGLEATPDEFVAALVGVFREVRRVLRGDGTCWLVLGDSYANDTKWGDSASGEHVAALHGQTGIGRGRRQTGLKSKDLLMVPARVAMALQADGWYLRSDIIWAKPNPMPESTTDRPTSSHEHVFLLTKRETYFYDGEAIRETAVSDRPSGNGYDRTERISIGGRGQKARWSDVGGTRNARNVWTFTASPYKGAHFAVFPPALVRNCILAGTSECGACAACGAQFHRVVEKGEPDREHQRRSGGDAQGEYAGQAVKDYSAAGAQNASDVKRRILAGMVQRRTVGWVKTCTCPDAYPLPSVVLDPFFGAGTTGLVAERLGRDCIGIELNPESVGLAAGRIRVEGGRVAC